jgi:uncharacterized membrane protein
MFWILEIFPHWLWWLLLLTGVSGYLLASFVTLKSYNLLLKIVSGVVVSVVIFIMGLLYADGVWQQAAQDLQQQVKVAEAKSQVVNTVVEERVVTKTQVVRQRGASTVEYIVREVVKHDPTCVVPAEFVTAHNRAAEAPK